MAAFSTSGRVTVLRTRDVDEPAEDLVEVATPISVVLGMISAAPR